MLKTRYLQLSDIMMLEYNMLGETGASETNINDLYVVKLKDEHLAMFCPSSYEIEKDVDGGYKKMFKPKSLNTINHLAVPDDKQGSFWYMFLDSDYKYCTSANIYDFYGADFNNDFNDDFDKSSLCYDIKANEYAKHIEYVTESKQYNLYRDIVGLRSDSIRLYFVNGYDFSNIYGVVMRIYMNLVTSDGTDKFIDLCNFAITKNNAYLLTSYLTNPIIFGNNIYDRYIEVNVPFNILSNENVQLTGLVVIFSIVTRSVVSISRSVISTPSSMIYENCILTDCLSKIFISLKKSESLSFSLNIISYIQGTFTSMYLS